jgi:hypothetical protein
MTEQSATKQLAWAASALLFSKREAMKIITEPLHAFRQTNTHACMLHEVFLMSE